MDYNRAREGKLRPVLEEYLLKGSGLAKGRLGSMNLMNREKNIIYSSSILGNNFSVSTGVSMAEKLKSSKNVTFVLGGDGSMEEGSFYESLVMMKSIGLSIVVVIENNEWSLGTHISERRECIDLAKLTDSVGVKYIRLEGNDIDSYIKILTDIRKECIENCEPICVEVILKTLGDRRNPPSAEYPEGKYINYHAGPSSTVDLQAELFGAILRESSDDPLFVLREKIGSDEFSEIVALVSDELKAELS
jgi:TPP-dependent pyruvate/acetoin dehydrogenase alpha subunit